MWEEEERRLPWPNLSTHKKASSSGKNKKSNITLAIDVEILDMVKNIAEGKGLSINAKINSILWKYVTFNKYIEQDCSFIIPSRLVNFL